MSDLSCTSLQSSFRRWIIVRLSHSCGGHYDLGQRRYDITLPFQDFMPPRWIQRGSDRKEALSHPSS
ncbi:hypothetical protein K0M31_018160 [Melipona bicolor]|uniref:Uncharacterized protein n=1 Tax=Melipona bicolor TaxID=60889 RepID=A0AA40FCY2_9HYME|nr:hypothetical protein K0M31_018160 [Melipona bicolor]